MIWKVLSNYHLPRAWNISLLIGGEGVGIRLAIHAGRGETLWWCDGDTTSEEVLFIRKSVPLFVREVLFGFLYTVDLKLYLPYYQNRTRIKYTELEIKKSRSVSSSYPHVYPAPATCQQQHNSSVSHEREWQLRRRG